MRTLAFALLATAMTTQAGHAFSIEGSAGSKLEATEVATFDQAWAMTFLDASNALVTTKPGKLYLVDTTSGTQREVTGLPKVTAGGQGGLGDIVLAPDHATSGMIYLSFVESLDKGATRGAVVVRGKLDPVAATFSDMEIVWKQEPKLPGKGHFSHRIAFGPAGSAHDGFMFITSGDRQKQKPAQDWTGNLGKVVRLKPDGTVPADNPFQDKGEIAKQVWTTGHRNLLGIAFAPDGKLWTHEMGPRHGDEINLIEPGANYGWPVVSDGDNYNGTPIPDHSTDTSFNAPEASWVPAISPSGLVIYDGDTFADWKGDAFIGGLSSQALIRVDIDGTTAKEAERFEWDKRIREVEQGPDGALWVLEDKQGRLLKLTPAS